ncbi:hypothetical protein JVT61DRAFT_7305 [Boletus reticuloceps]|uniref:Uncharacterized protein n=1 Tax=Boletus reticuloceps TaxID=495285 RepID=A0A8I2YJ71_9AGAM|nr:hypothetical protein JVT61DRAFT_7305 [Boletus reticuloceps]
MVRSGLMHHFQTQLKANADRLGLNNVSRPFVDDTDGLSKLTLTPSRPLPDASRPHANLVSLHLAYTWRTVTRRSDIANSGHLVEDTNPFSPTLFLPSEALLNRVTEQFLIYHLVSRYPLIFGPWCKRLDMEMQYFPSISHSIVEIMTRSKNHRFLSKCKRLLKIARRQHKFVLQTATAALSSCTDNAGTSEEDLDGLSATPVLTDEQILCESLEQLFRMGVPKRRFKPVAKVTPQSVSFPQDDDDSLLQCIPDVGIDDETSWTELPEIAMSPCGLVADDYETLPEDFDVFAQEDWSEGGMWRLPHHEADAGQGEREFDAPLDESLIGGSISLASITTRPAQTDPVSLYHHQGVDHREVDPAASGLGYKVSQLAFLEDAGTPAVFSDLTHSPSHGHYYLVNYEQVMRCQVDSEGFEGLDSWSDGDEMADLDSLLLEADVPDGADVTGFEEPLV